MAGCASAPIDAGPPDVASTAAAVPAVPAEPPAATLTPAQRQARAKQAARQADQAAQQALQRQCTDLRAQIRDEQLDEQQAASTSISEPIVQAREAHADKRIQELKDRYDSLDCERIDGPRRHTPMVPVAPAPDALSPPGAQGIPGVP